jgi:phage terminase large subunit-like protein
MNYIEKANEYIRQVLAGEIVTNKWTRMACLRQKEDLEKTWEYVFNPEAASIPCEFLESLTHVAGEHGGEKLVLENWQCFFITTIFGWRLKANPRMRRFRRSFVECGKGNGKSFISSGLCLYMLCCDGEAGSQVITAARSADQARVVYDVARQRVLSNDELASTFGLKPMKKAIEHEATASSMWPVGGIGKNVAWALPYFVSADETWAHKDRVLVDELSRGCAKRANSLMSTITHAGDNLGSVGYEQHEIACSILAKDITDEKTFACIWSCDGFLWTDENAWKAANPNYGVSVYPDELASACALAQKITTTQGIFRSHNLCEWVGADITWIEPAKLDLCREGGLRIEDFKYWHANETPSVKEAKIHRPFVLGMDLASRQDIASVVWMCIGYIDGVEHYYAWSTNYLPNDTVQNFPIAGYTGWAARGNIIVHPGATISFESIEQDILTRYRRLIGYGAVDNPEGFKIKAAAYDSWQAHQISENLETAGIDAIEFSKNAKTYSPVMDLFAALVLEGRFHMAKADAVLFWALTNIACHRDKNDNLFPNKAGGDPNRKIDPAISLLYALKCAIADGGKYVKPDSPESCGIIVLDDRYSPERKMEK